MSSKKKLFYRILCYSCFLLLVLCFYFCQRYHPLFLYFSSAPKITISTINPELHSIKKKEIVVEDKNLVEELLQLISHKLFFDTYEPDCMCIRDYKSFGIYKISIDDAYEIILPSSSTMDSNIQIELIKKNKYSILAFFPSSFLQKIKEILPIEYLEETLDGSAI